MAECLLRRSGAFHDVRSPPISAPIPMRKQLTGEPVAGDLHTGFGGRGRRQPFPTPIRGLKAAANAHQIFTGGDWTCLNSYPSDTGTATGMTAPTQPFATRPTPMTRGC